MRFDRWFRTVLVIAGLAVVGLGSGCQEDERTGGSITIALSAQPDYLDPALSNTINGWEPMWLVYTPLLTYRRAEGAAGAELIPGLAEALPELSADGRTYQLRLRQGLEYSDGSPVRASDFEHTIKRVLQLKSLGSSYYLGIEGARDYAEQGEPEADIPGIATNDRTGAIRITLDSPDGTFSNALAANFAGLVPRAAPFENLTRDPPAGVGPYRITRSAPNREFVMQKNVGFDIDGVLPGKLEKITVRIVPSLERQAQDVIDGRLDYMQDPPPANLLGEIRSEHSDRYREYPSLATLFFFLNTRLAPFDKLDVRRAVNFALDKRALARLFAGLMEPACTFLPPGVPGHDGSAPCPYGDPAGSPDLARARRLVERSGARGAEVTVWSLNQSPGPEVASYYADVLNEIGLDARQKVVAVPVYSQTVGSQRTGAQTGFASWLGDYPHPNAFLRQFSGAVITETGNINLGNVDDPALNAGIARLGRQTDLSGVEDDWARLDHLLIERAYVAVYGHAKRTTFMSDRMDFANCSRVHPLYQNDYSSFCLK